MMLGTEAIGGFHVETLADQPAGTVMQEIETFFDGRSREDLVLLYFSGHGILDEGARLYFATTDTRIDRPRSTAVPAAFVNDVMSECRSRRQVLVLESDHGIPQEAPDAVIAAVHEIVNTVRRDHRDQLDHR